MGDIIRKNYFLVFVFLIGFFSTVTQIILIREFLVIFYGNELCLGTIFLGWLMWVFIGAYHSKKIIRKSKGPVNIFIYLLFALVVVLPVDVLIIRDLRFIINVSSYQIFPFYFMILTVLVLLAPVCFITGFMFPLCVKICSIKGNNAVSRTYMFESLGSMVGGMFFTFCLVNLFSNIQMIFLSGFVMLAYTAIYFYLEKTNRKILYLNLFFIIVFVLLLFTSSKIDSLLVRERWHSFASGIDFLENKDTKYQNISIGIRNGQYSLFENGHVSASFPDPYTDAVFIHPVLTQHPNPKRVLIVGIPTTDFINESLLHNIDEIHFVQLDPKVIDIISKYNNLEWFGDKLKIFNVDGRYFVKTTREKYDIVVVNLQDPSTSLINRFYTKEFFLEVKNILNENGVFVTGVTSALNYFGSEIGDYNVSIYNTIKHVFDYCIAVPGTKVCFFASSKDVLTFDTKVLAKRYIKRKVTSKFFNEYYFDTLYEKDKINWLKNELEKYPEKTLNTDLKPITYFFNLVLWSRFSDVFVFGLFKKIVVVLIVASIAFLYFLIRKRDNKSKLNLSIFVIGFTGMFLEILLLFSFQNIKGYLYAEIGLFIGLFMFGLAIGSFIAEKFKKTTINLFVFFQVVLVIIISLMVVYLYFFVDMGLDIYLLFTVLFVIIGFITGVLFIMANKLYPRDEDMDASSKLYGFDNFGAALGAFFGSIFLIPVAGIGFSCLYLILLNILSGINLLYNGKSI